MMYLTDRALPITSITGGTQWPRIVMTQLFLPIHEQSFAWFGIPEAYDSTSTNPHVHSYRD